MSEAREFELKLEVNPRQLPRLKSRGLESFGEPQARQRLSSVYYDTPDHRLRQNGLTLRVRSVGGQHIQTIKASQAGPGVGLFDRSEWETVVETPEPDLEAAARTPLNKLLADKASAGLQPVFTAEFDRTTWLAHTDKALIEIALDEGIVSAQGAGSKVAELEFELKRGDVEELFALARRLDGAGSFKLGVLTKSDRGYRVAAGESATFHKAEPLRLRQGMAVADAFATIVRACIRHFRLNEDGLVERRLPEALHQARVAIRRLRAALSLFKDLIGDPDSQALRERLRTFSGHLGRARDLDVYLARAEAAPDGAPEPDPAWVAKLKSDREEAYDRIGKVLASKPFRGLMLDLLAWVEQGGWRNPDDEDARARLAQPIEAAAAAILAKRRRRVKRRGRDLAGLFPEARHEVRIEAKKLRYAAEFVSGLVEGKAEKRRYKTFLSALEDLQECLGDLNDIETARLLHAEHALPGMAAAEDPEREEDLIEEAAAAHAAFSDAKPFWRDFA